MPASTSAVHMYTISSSSLLSIALDSTSLLASICGRRHHPDDPTTFVQVEGWAVVIDLRLLRF